MAVCEVCGNDYDKAFEVVAAGERHIFDSFECATHRLAPICEHCGCKVIGHGTEVDVDTSGAMAAPEGRSHTNPYRRQWHA